MEIFWYIEVFEKYYNRWMKGDNKVSKKLDLLQLWYKNDASREENLRKYVKTKAKKG